MKKILSLLLALVFGFQLLFPVAVNAEGNEYFSVNKTSANPGQDITVRYRLKIEADKHYYMKYCPVGTPVNVGENGRTHDLDQEKQGEYITGEWTFKTLKEPLGQYEIRVIGPIPLSSDSGTVIEQYLKGIGTAARNVLTALGITENSGREYGIILQSSPITVSQYQAKVSCSSVIRPGEKLTVSYENASSYSNSWIGLFEKGGMDSAPWRRQVLSGKTNGSVEFEMPPARYGEYECRIFLDDGYTKIGTSNLVNFQNSSTSFSGIPVSLKVSEEATINYSGAPNQSNAWIGLFKESSPDNSPEGYTKFIRFNTSGSFSFKPSFPVKHNIRMFDENNKRVGISNDFAVSAANTAGTTAVPAAASSSITLRAQAAAGYVKLDWNAVTDPRGVAGYYVYKSNSAGGQTSIPETDFYINGTTYNDTKVVTGTTYYYIVKPVYNNENIGNASNEVSAAPLPGGGTIELTIDNPVMKANGVQKEIDPGVGTTPVIKDGRTFLPIRAVIEEMGGTIGWSDTEQKVTLQCNGKTVELWIGKNNVRVDGIDKNMDVAPYVSDTGRTMLPLRFVGENLGCVISWAGATQTATIVYDKSSNPAQNAASTQVQTNQNTGTQTSASATTPGTANNSGTSSTQQGNISWTGVWDTTRGSMIVTQTGNSVSGTYESDDFTLNGSVSGNTLSGTFNENGDQGSFELKIFQDGTFSGRYRYAGDEDLGDWSGTRVTDSFGSTGTAWGGVWYTDYGPMIITQNGSSFTGVYKGAGKYAIKGTISGTTVKGRIDEGNNKGDFEFNLYSDGKSFAGKWHYDGEEEWADWTGTKKK